MCRGRPLWFYLEWTNSQRTAWHLLCFPCIETGITRQCTARPGLLLGEPHCAAGCICLNYCPRKCDARVDGNKIKSKGHLHFKKCVSLLLNFGEWIKRVVLVLEETTGRDSSRGIGGRKWMRKEKMEPRTKGNETPLWIWNWKWSE